MKSPTSKKPVARRRALITTEPLEPRCMLSSYTVNTLSDSANPGSGLLTLRQAVADANAHSGADTINFSTALFSTSGLKTITLTQGQLDLTDKTGATTITGPGASKLAISGHSSSRIFDISSSVTATISGVTLSGGVGSIGPDTRYDGGAIVNQGTLTLNSTTLSNNKADPSGAFDHSAHGGAIYSSGTLTIQSSTLSGNTATGADPDNQSSLHQGYTGAGGAVYSTGPVTITSSTLTDNSAKGDATYCGNAEGGAVYDSGKLTITGSTLTGNSALGGETTLSIQIPNGGTGSGGAIFSTTSTTVTSSTISGNKANGSTAPYGTNGGAYGGGVWGGGTLVVSNSVVTSNSITSGNDEVPGGGANRHADGGGIYSVGSLSLTQSNVSGNTALGGEGLYDLDTGSTARDGGVFAGGTLTVSQSSITGNRATGGVGDFGSSAPPVDGAVGGNAQGAGLWAGGGSTLTDSTIANNSAIGGAGGSDSQGVPPGTTTGNNGGNATGGGVYADAGLNVYDSTVSGNTTTAGAGGAGYTAYPAGSKPNIPAGKNGSAQAAGLYVAAKTTLLDNTIVSANKAANVFNDIAGSILSTSANNLVGTGSGLTNGVHGNKTGITNPELSALANHGGNTLTMVPLTGSPAINAGSNSLIPSGVTTDERGFARIIAGTVDIGAVEVGATLSGEVFNDANGNGKLDSSEAGLTGWTVYLDLNKDGKLDTGDISTTTNAGNFSFSSLAPGTYSVRVVPMKTYDPTKPTGGVLTLTLTVGESSTGNLFGEKLIAG